jgi:signal transduction histidine kinase
MDLKAILREVTETFSAQFISQSIRLDIDVPDNLWVEIDPILIREAVRKIVENAAEAMATGGTLTITSLVGRHGLEIEIADSGPGLPEEIQERLFQPFVTDKDSHAGLGLSIVHEIAAAHHGSVSAQNCPDGGAAFTIFLPVRDAMRAAA